MDSFYKTLTNLFMHITALQLKRRPELLWRFWQLPFLF